MARKVKGKGRKKKGSVRVNFEGVETRQLVDEADYLTTITAATEEEGEEHPYIQYVHTIKEGKFKGSTIPNRCSLSPKALWNLRSVLEALGEDVPDEEMDVVYSDHVGQEVGVTVERGRYGGRPQNEIVDVFPADDVGEDDDDEDESPDEDDIKKMSEDELEEAIEEFDLDLDLDDFKGIKKKRQAVIDAFDEEGEDDEDEDDDEDGETYSRDDINAMKSKELEELVEEHDLDVELDGAIKKKRRAVIKALDEEDLLED